MSLLAAGVASWWLYLDRPDTLRLIAVIALSSALALVRDTAAFVIFAAGILVTLDAFRGRLRYASWPRNHGILAAACILIFSAVLASHLHGGRWRAPFYNLVGQRILSLPSNVRFFEESGMPVTPALLSRNGRLASSDNRFFYRSPRLEPFRQWAEASGRKTYLTFLWTRPLRTVTAPIADLPRLLDEDHRAYASPRFSRTLAARIAAAFHGAVPASSAILISLLLFAALALSPALRTSPGAALVFALLLLGVVHLLIAWHGDANEVPRHSLPAILQFQVAAVLAASLLLNSGLSASVSSPGPDS